ncbi:MAG: glycosyltransferase [Cyclobacteriaceae bacterium]|nr:glycosyltransferase [Cyclobacteriaceae bacterium SS2]
MIFFLSLSLLRILYVQLLAIMWWRIPGGKSHSTLSATFSVLIPVRNEEENIVALLQDLENQDYPQKLFEVMVIDDHSEDQTVTLVNEFIKSTALNIRVIQLDEQNGKKAAITQGIQLANNEYILATDGDCRIPATWIKTFASRFDDHDDPNMVVAPVLMESDNLFTNMQSLEFSALIGYGGSSLQMGFAGTCNGANIGYKRAIFQEVDGYVGNEKVPSGDDEFLMFKIFNKYPGTVRFLKSPDVVVRTPAKKTLLELINQRIRWSSKWKFHKSIYVSLTAITFFIDYAMLIAAVVLAMLGLIEFTTVASVLLLRWLTEYYYISNVVRFLGGKSRWFNFLAMQIIYPVFVIFLGIASIFGIYHWKGRAYS